MNPRTTLQAPGTAGKHLILLVDDDPDMLQFLKPSLTTETLSCITAGSVAEAITALRKYRVSLLVLDWMLDRSGAEVLKAAREICPEIPVVVLSGQPHEVRTDAILQGVDAFLQKPVSSLVLQTQVRQLLLRVPDPATPLLPRCAEEALPLNDLKNLYMKHVVSLLGGNVSLAARRLGVHRQTIAAALEQPGSAHPVLKRFRTEARSGKPPGRTETLCIQHS